MTPSDQSMPLVWFLLLGCGGASVVIFFYIWTLTRQSAKALRAELVMRNNELKDLLHEVHNRFTKIDRLIVSEQRTLSARGAEAFSMARQIASRMGARFHEVEKILQTGSFDELIRGREILDTPIDNTGVQFDAIVFADTILTLQPDQFKIALSMIVDIVEDDLRRNTETIGKIQVAPPMHREARAKKFTIRGFLRSLTAKDPESGF